MAKYSNEVIYNIKTNLDKSGVTRLNAELQQVTNKLTQMQSRGLIRKEETAEALKNIAVVKAALNNSFNVQTGMLNLNSFNKQLSSAGLTTNKLGQSFRTAGAQGTAAFNSLMAATGKLDTNFKSLSTSGQKIMNTIGNTARWGVVSMAFQSIVTSISSAVNYVEKLDDSLIQIRMVSGESAENMRKFAEYANKAASGLGSTTVDFTNATKLFIQEGFSLEESKRQATQATILANVSEQDTATTADQITAYRNAFLKDSNGNALQGQAAIDQMGISLDKFANIANNTAANVNELMVASQRAASTAAAVGADEDSFLASVATIQSVTRESAENIGNGLKSIYTRFADIKMGKDTEDGVSLGQYGQALQSAGVNILDENGQFKGMTQIFSELQEAWKTLSDTQKVAVGEKVAGRFQYNRFAALMNNPEYFEKAYNASVDSEGAMERMQDTFMEGIEAKQNELRTEFESFLTEIYNSNDFAGMVEGLTDVVSMIHDATDSVGGLGNAFTGLGAIMMKVFSNGIGEQIARITTNMQKQQQAAVNMKEAETKARATLAANNINTGTARSDDFIKSQSTINQYASIMSNEQTQKATEIKEQYVQVLNEVELAEGKVTEKQKAAYEIFARTEAKVMEGVTCWKEFEEKVRATGLAGEKFESMMKELGGEIEASTGIYENASRNMLGWADSLKVAEKSGTGVALVAKEFQEELELLARKEIEDSEAQKEYAASAKEVSEMIKNESIDVKRLNEILESNQKITAETAATMRGIVDNVKATVNSIAREVDALEAQKVALRDVSREAEIFSASLKTQAMVTGLANATSALMNFSFTMMSVKNLGNIWSDEDLSINEKISESLIDIAMISSMTLVPALTSVMTAFKGQARVLGEVAMANELNNEKSRLSRMYMALDTLEIKKKNATTKKEVEVLNARIASVRANIEAERQSIVTDATKGKTLSSLIAKKKADIAATLGQAVAYLTAHPAILLVASALAVLGTAAYAAYKQWNKEAEAAEKATEAAKEAGEVYNETKKAFKDFGESSKGYQEAEQALSELTKGTEEWANKLNEVNEKAEELLEKYPQLARYAQYTSDGVLNISQEGIDELNKTLQENANLAHASALAANQNKLEAENDLSFRNIQREISLFGVDDNLVSQVVQAIQENPTLMMGEREDVIDKLSTAFPFLSSETIQSIATHAGQIVPLVESISKNEESIAANAEMAGMNILKNEKGFDTSADYATQVAKVVGEAGNKNSAQYQESLKKFSTSYEHYNEYTGESTTVYKDNIDAITKAFKEQTGARDLKDEGNGKYSYTDASGGTQTTDIDAMREQVVAADAMKQAAAKWESIANLLKNSLTGNIGNDQYRRDAAEKGINLSSSGTTDAFGKFLNGQDLSSLSSEELSSIYSTVTQGGWNTEALITNEEAKKLGFDGGSTEAVEAFIKAINDATGGMVELTNSVENLKKKETPDQLRNQLPDLQNQYNEALLTGNSTLAFETGTQIANINQQIDAYEKQEEAIWGNVKSIEQLDYVQNNLGKNSDRYQKQLARLGSIYSDLNEWTKKLSDDSIPSALKKDEEAIVRQVLAWRDAEKNLRKYVDAVNNGEKSIEDFAKTYGSDLNKALDFDEGTGLSQETIAKNFDLITTALAGLGEESDLAYLKLRRIGEEEIKVPIRTEWENGDFGTEINSRVNEIRNAIPEGDIATLSIGSYYNNAGIEAMANSLAQAMHIAGASAEEIEQALSGIEGLDAEVTYTDVYGPSEEDTVGGVPIARVPNVKFKRTPITTSGGSSSHNSLGGSGGGSGGGGGGGGGGGKSKTIDTSKTEKAKDIYQEVNQSLERIEKRYDRINNITDKLYGRDRINNIKKAAEAEKQHAQVINDKLKIQMKELDTLRNSTEDVNGKKTIGAFLGPDAFDENGTIRQEVYEAKYDELFDAIKSFEGKDEEANKDAYQAAQDELKDFTDAISAYYEALNGKDELISNLDDSLQEFSDLAVSANEALEEMTQNVLEMNDAFDNIVDVYKWIENGLGEQIWTTGLDSALRHSQTFFNQSIMNDLTGHRVTGKVELAADTSDFWQKQLQLYETYMRPLYEEWVRVSSDDSSTAEEIEAAFNAIQTMAEQIDYHGGTQQELMDKVKESYSDLESTLSDAQSQIEDLTDEIDEQFDTVIDQMDRRIEQYDTITDNIESSMDMMEMLYGDQSYANRNLFQQQLINTLSGKIQDLQFSIENQTKIVETYKDVYGENSAEYQDAMDKLNDYQGQLNETASKIQETVDAEYEDRINDTINKYTNGLLGGTVDPVTGQIVGDDLDWISTKWDLITKNADQYYDDVERAYNLQKLQNKYNDMLNNETNLLNQEKITAQMEQQMKYLREKANLSEHDVAYAEAQLDILQKTIALQEAQANKSKMKLKRDSQGNYSYAYAADEAEVSKAQNDLLEAQYNAYDISKKANLEAQESIMDAISSFKGNLADVLTNKNLSPETQLERVRFLIENFKQFVENSAGDARTISQQVLTEAQNISQMIVNENGVGLNKILSDTQLTSSQMLGEIDERLDSFVIERLDNLTQLDDGLDALFQDAENAMVQWREQTEKNLEAVGKTYNTFVEDSVKPAVASTQELLQATTDIFGELKKKMDEAISASKQLLAIDAVFRPQAQSAANAGSIANLFGDIPRFATGGYVGSWSGNIGKLAVVDSGEIVLNAGETENILSAVEIIRNMTNQMKNGALGGIMNLMSYKDKIGMSDGGNDIQQRVSIEANFPNASDAEEIKRALLSISDNAYQYVSRNY